MLTHSNDTHHSLLTQGVDSTSVNRVESTKHQRIRTPPTPWCRKFDQLIAIMIACDFLITIHSHLKDNVLRAAHCGAAFSTGYIATDYPSACHVLDLEI